MAMSLSSTFTATDRRKRMVTYGKSSRIATNLNGTEDAPSPERPRKQAGATNRGLKRPGGALGASGTLASIHTNTQKPSATGDIFDVPDDDDFALAHDAAPKWKPSLKISSKTSLRQPATAPPVDEFGGPSSEHEAPQPNRRADKINQPLRKPQPTPLASKEKSHKTSQVAAPLPNEPLPSQKRRGKTPQAVQKPEKLGQMTTEPTKRTTAKAKAPSRATTPAPTAPNTQKVKSASVLPSEKSVTKPASKRSAEADIFEVPSSDEDASPQLPRRPRPIPLSRPEVRIPSASTFLLSPKDSADSDDSTASKKRKRQVSVPSGTIVPATKERKRELSAPQRSKKYQKKEDSVSPGNRVSKQAQSTLSVANSSEESTINKPKRTRIRTVPGPSRAPVVKGQSSPAKLHGMLAVRSMPMSRRPPVPEMPEITAIEEETMYDIRAPVTPLVKATKSATASSVTPRQKTLLNNLLGNLSDTATPMPSISRLQLTDKKPVPLLAGLNRSTSEIPQTAYSKKTRLIDTLRQAASSSDNEESESDEGIEEDITEIPNLSASEEVNNRRDSISALSAEVMDVDNGVPTNSQASQTAVLLNTGAKTYARQRTYLEETSEDGLLLAMDIDDDLGIESQKQDTFTDDEEDPSSQVRGIHELRRQGQHQKFQMEAQSSIDEIADRSSGAKGIRRSSMMEFTTRMAEQKFIEQLLESALSHQFIRSISSNGEIIFDFTAAVAVAFILDTKPGLTILDQIYRSDIIATLTRLLDFDRDIQRLAKERKTNLSKIAQESVSEFRRVIQESSICPPEKTESVSPQLIAMSCLEYLVLGLRKAGNMDALLQEDVVTKLITIASGACERLKAGKQTRVDLTILDMTFSILEAASVAKQQRTTWSTDVLHRLMDIMPVFFATSNNPLIKLVIRLCMNLTNNKPKACEIFAKPAFVQPLTRSISQRFDLLATELEEEQRMETMEGLILSLGAMINLAEFNDQARTSVVSGGDELIEALVTIFLEGSERAAQADSMEESQTSVTVGYLTVLLGNLCLNDTVRCKIQSRLPEGRIDMLVDNIREFILYNQRVDRATNQLEGVEGRETWQTFTKRLMLVVEQLEKTKT